MGEMKAELTSEEFTKVAIKIDGDPNAVRTHHSADGGVVIACDLGAGIGRVSIVATDREADVAASAEDADAPSPDAGDDPSAQADGDGGDASAQEEED